MSSDIELDNKKLLGLVASNSPTYIESIFDALASGRIVVPLRTAEDEARINATGLKELITPNAKTGWFSPRFNPQTIATAAQISFTSGTEGTPKGVILSHKALHNVIERLIAISGIDASAREYIGVPVYHSFGYGRCRLLGTVGGQAYIPPKGFNPSEIAQMLREQSINSLSAVPSLLRVLLEHKDVFGDERHALRWIEIGSQPMSGDEKSALRDVFPEACIVQHYGLTEASRTSLLRIDGAKPAELESVGKAYGDTEMTISDTGRIRIRGSHLASGLLIDGEIHPLTNSDGWFETSDLGRLENGFLFFEGRADNMINCGGQKIAAETIEKEIFAHFGLSGGVAASRVPNTDYGEGVLVAKTSALDVSDQALEEFVNEVLSRHGVDASSAVLMMNLASLPVTDTGKVQRKALVSMFQKSTNEKVNLHKPDSENTSGDPLATLLTLFRKKSGPTKKVSAEDSVESLGLDSISVVSISIEIEKRAGYIPNNFRSLSIAELAQLEKTADKNISDKSGRRERVKGADNENPTDLSFWSLIKEDFITHERDFFSQGFWAIFNHRFGNWRMSVSAKILRAPLTLLYFAHKKCVQIFCGIKLDYTVKLGRRVKLEHFGGMIIGATEIGDDVTLRQNTTLGIRDLSDLEGKPTLEQGVNVGTGAVIVGRIRVGRYSVIGPNAVVDADIPPFSTVTAAASIVTQHTENE